MRIVSLAVAAAIALAPAAALAKSRAAPKPAVSGLSVTDIRTCMGLNGSKPSEQVVACTKVLTIGKVKPPYNADYYATRGAAYLALRQPDKALLDTDKALSIRKSAEFYLQRGIVHMALDKPDEAKADFAEVIRLKPEFAQVYLFRGLVSYEEGNFPEAVTYFDDAVKRKPKYPQALFARGVAKKRNGDSSGDRDITEARNLSTHVDADLGRFGLTP